VRERSPHVEHGVTKALLLVTLWLCVSCAASPRPTSTAAPVPATSLYNTSAAPLARATLPPTWTPTPTLTPSLTLTPSQTLTPTATYSLDDLCATLEVDFPYNDGHLFAADDTLLLFFGTVERTWTSPIQPATPAPNATSPPSISNTTPRLALLTEPIRVRFMAAHRDTGENLGAEAAGGEITALELPVSQLPLPGLYDWSVSIYIGTLGAQCTQTGTFSVAAAEATLEAP
jgi:hypothetical protein